MTDILPPYPPAPPPTHADVISAPSTSTSTSTISPPYPLPVTQSPPTTPAPTPPVVAIMVDLETMGTSATAAIVSIGAQAFDPHAGSYTTHPFLDSGLHINVLLQSSLDAGLTLDAATVYWWLTQSDEARAALVSPPPLSLTNALYALNYYLYDALHRARKPLPDGTEPVLQMWSHGATFDLPILGEAYRRAHVTRPWSFRDARDTRTLYDLCHHTPLPRLPEHPRHHALGDAQAQACDVQACYKQLRIQRFTTEALIERLTRQQVQYSSNND